MRVRSCPQCQQQSLVPTGGFWACAGCGYAITTAALIVEHAVAPAGRNYASSGRHASKEFNS